MFVKKIHKIKKKNIIVVGGYKIHPNSIGHGHVEHLTIRQSKEYGVFGHSSFTIILEQCGWSGVVASGSSTVLNKDTSKFYKLHIHISQTFRILLNILF
jgi:hypothetical protein